MALFLNIGSRGLKVNGTEVITASRVLQNLTVGMHLLPDAPGTRHIGSAAAPWVNAHFSGAVNAGSLNVTFGHVSLSHASAQVRQNTSSGADTGSVTLAGGGGASASRGAFLRLYGRDVASGRVELYMSDAPAADLRIIRGTTEVARFTDRLNMGSIAAGQSEPFGARFGGGVHFDRHLHLSPAAGVLIWGENGGGTSQVPIMGRSLVSARFPFPTVTGAIVITTAIPAVGGTGSPQTMFQVRLRGFNYNPPRTWQIDIMGYAFSTAILTPTQARIGNWSPTVRLAVNSNNFLVIVLGVVTDVHQYPAMWVDDVMIQFNGASTPARLRGWSIDIVDDLSGYTSVVTVPNP